MADERRAALRRALRADPALAAALQAGLDPLVAYDRTQGGDLVRTLAVVLAEGANVTAAATALYLHRNSLYYRLAHIEALTGLTLKDEMDRLWLHLAVILAGPDLAEDSDEQRTDPPERA